VTQAPRRPALAGARRRVSAIGGLGEGTGLRRYLPVMAVVALSLLVVAGLAVAPVRRYFSQGEQTGAAEAELEGLQAEVADLDARLEELRTDAAVERIARQHYDLVFPGEESYRILPAPAPDAPPAPDQSGVAEDPAGAEAGPDDTARADAAPEGSGAGEAGEAGEAGDAEGP
jgi:cell division protein FtsB